MISRHVFIRLQRLMVRTSGLVIGDDKDYLVHSRLTPLVALYDLADIDGLVALAEHDDQVARRCAEALCIHETSWFRDRHPFEAITALVSEAATGLTHPAPTMSIWSAGCSTGQEPYSIVMTVASNPTLRHVDCQVTATDLSEEALTTAARGSYSQLEINRGLPASELLTNFRRHGTRWQIDTAIRSQVTFRRTNLADPHHPFMGRFDIVLCRNVLLYLDAPSRQVALTTIARHLAPGGHLMLGSTELLSGVDGWTERVVGRTRLYQPTENTDTRPPTRPRHQSPPP